jgi:hydroxypyruvate isomerase
MPRFCANLTFLFTEVPLLQRIGAAAAAGFEAVEILFPYEEPASAVAEEARLARLPIALINTPPPNWTGGDRGYAATPGGEDRFRTDFERALRFAKVLGPQHIHIMAGRAEGPEARATYIRNLRWAAERAPRQSLTIEPINRHDMPGYFLADFPLAVDILHEVDAPNLRLQFDAYHAHLIHGDVAAMWELCAAQVVHVQIADAPARNEPGTGEIDWTEFFAALDASGYKGWVSAEYRPAGRTSDGLSWLAAAS